MTKADFLAALHAAHAPIAAAVAGLSDDRWMDPAPGMDGWTRKDVLAHAGWWTDHSVRVITALVAGRVPYDRDGDFDIDAQNRSIRDEWRDRELPEVRAFEATAFQRLVAAVEAASDEDLFATDRFAWLGDESLAAAIEWDSTKHYPDHLAHITA